MTEMELEKSELIDWATEIICFNPYEQEPEKALVLEDRKVVCSGAKGILSITVFDRILRLPFESAVENQSLTLNEVVVTDDDGHAVPIGLDSKSIRFSKNNIHDDLICQFVYGGSSQ